MIVTTLNYDISYFRYSIKNIPIPSEKNYKLQLLEKTEMLIKRMRWKAIFFNNKFLKNNENTSSNTFKINTVKYPQQVKEMVSFENPLLDLVKNIKFRKIQSNFQTNLNEDVKTIRKSEKTLTHADKSLICTSYLKRNTIIY